MADQQTMSIARAARVLGKHPRTIYNYVASGRLEAIYIGAQRSPRVLITSVLALQAHPVKRGPKGYR